MDISSFNSLDHISPANRKGRNPREGYQRGGGLHHEKLGEKIMQDEHFRAALALAEGRSIVGREKLMNLYLLIRFFLPKLAFGHIIEFGSYRGGSALFMARILKIYLPNVHIWALDSFEGMPPVDRAIDAHWPGDFRDTQFEEVCASADKAQLDNVHFVKGRFEETAPAVLRECRAVVLTHIDCDIYSAVAYSYDAAKPYMVPGAYVVFDDITEPACLGATEVMEELLVRRDDLCAEQANPHFVFRYPPLRD